MLARKLLSGNKFSLVRSYTTGTGATETVPAGASMVKMTVDAGGAAGAFDNISYEPGGGGGGSRAVKSIAVIPGDTLTYTVGAIRAGRSSYGIGGNGNPSSVSGTVSGGTVAMTAGGGLGGRLAGLGGFGGTASGGDVNSIGSQGGAPEGGASASGAAGGNPPGGGGAGVIVLTSGAGARGEIKFEYS